MRAFFHIVLLVGAIRKWAGRYELHEALRDGVYVAPGTGEQQSASIKPNRPERKGLMLRSLNVLKEEGFSRFGVHGHVTLVRRLAVCGLDDAGDEPYRSTLRP